MKLLATRETYYAGRTYHAGEVFEVRDNHVKTLRTLKHCKDAPTERVEPAMLAPVKPMDTGNSEAIVPVRRGRYARRDERAEDTPISEMTPEAVGAYARRDMRVEENNDD